MLQSSRLRAPIPLSPSLAERLARVWHRVLEHRRAARIAAAERAWVGQLDAATRRDLGLLDGFDTGPADRPGGYGPWRDDPYHF